MKKFTVIILLFLSIDVISQELFVTGGGSCSVGERKVRCRDLNSTPSSDKEIEINSCSISCNDSKPVCIPGYLNGSNCNDSVEPSRCYCN